MDSKNNNVFPYNITNIDNGLANEMMKYFTGEHTGFVQIGPKKYFMSNKYKEVAEKIYTMKVRPTDIYVSSYPRSGTTWTQELIWMVANDLDYDGSNAVPLTERYPFLEFSTFVHPEMMKRFTEENKDSEKKLQMLAQVTGEGTQQLAGIPSPRFIKTHLPLTLLPPDLLDTAKMVHVARDPRDVVVSFYHLNKSMRTQGYVGDFKTYWHYFKNNLHHWTPYFDNVLEYWDKRHHKNMLFLFYEDLVKDLPTAIRRVVDFFGKEITNEQVKRLCDHLSIESFKNNKSVNYDVMSILGILKSNESGFIRKGKAGGWRDYFVDGMAEEAEAWIKDNLKNTDFRYPHMNID